jgi:hypothetical protein
LSSQRDWAGFRKIWLLEIHSEIHRSRIKIARNLHRLEFTTGSLLDSIYDRRGVSGTAREPELAPPVIERPRTVSFTANVNHN